METGVMTNIAETQLIALDWGTTSVRAYRMGRNGTVLAERSAPHGIMQVAATASAQAVALETSFAMSLHGLCADWLAAYRDAPIVACGMVGSQQGWVEASYRLTPAVLNSPDFELSVVEFDADRRLYIIPGILDSKDLPDVMRGEETQILGALELDEDNGKLEKKQLFLLPGTHSKWAQVTGRTITEFSTSMTGETYSLLKDQSILSKLVEPSSAAKWEAFERGVRVSQRSSGAVDVMLTAFSARTLVLTDRLHRTEVSDYLSGLMIGAEIRSVISEWPSSALPPITICGNQELSSRYTRALESFGITDVRSMTGTAPRGIWAVASSVGLL